ncbi:MAG: hypothetical protein ACFCVK_24755 [Acidimicrobiales bacterium]
MVQSSIPPLLGELRTASTGSVMSVSRVVDALLDLRSLAVDEPDVLGLIDATMSTVPGQTVVTTAWWDLQLDIIEREWDLAEGVGASTELDTPAAAGTPPN